MKKEMIQTAVIGLMTILAFSAGAVDKPISASPKDKDLKWGPCPAFFPTGCELAVLQGDPAEPNADLYFKIPGGYKFPAHWHTSAERMVLVSGEINVQYHGQPTIHLKKGMYAYGPAKAVHKGKCISKKDCVLVIAFEEPVDAHEHK